MRAFLFAVPCLLLSTSLPAQPQHPSRVDLAFNRFYNFEEMTEALRALVRAYPELLDLRSIGKSTQGRDLWLVTLNQPRTGADRTKPAIYIDGNIHGNEVQGAEVCLYTLWYLTKSYGRIEQVTELVDERAFYLLPMVNPDGRAYWFRRANTPHSSRGNQVPVDSDRDGQFDEDPPDDLDGDGSITQMRVRDPNGRWRRSKAEPRLMERVPFGETGGEFTLLGSEGIDNDGDGRINEDGPGGYDLNRNWPSDWQPNHIQGGAGDYPLCFPETRAIADFIQDHPNIAAVQAYHNWGGMLLRGPGARYVPEYPRRDLQTYDHLGRLGEKILPHYRYMVIWKDLYTVHGGFLDWVYEGRGIFGFSNELFTPAHYLAGGSGEGPRANREALLEFSDVLSLGENFSDWKEVDHPTYGKVEVGGLSQYSLRVPPPYLLEELCHRNMAFTLYHARQMPRLELRIVEVEPLEGEVRSVTVEVKNTRVIPSIAQRAEQNQVGAPDLLTIQAAEEDKPLEVLAGGPLADPLRGRLEPVRRRPARLVVPGGIPGMAARQFRWFVRGQGDALVRYRSEKGGTREVRVKLGG